VIDDGRERKRERERERETCLEVDAVNGNKRERERILRRGGNKKWCREIGLRSDGRERRRRR
jgi:hypothetical protein